MSSKTPIAFAACAVAAILAATVLWQRRTPQVPLQEDTRAQETSRQQAAMEPHDVVRPATSTAALTPAAQAAIAGIVSRRQREHEARIQSKAQGWSSVHRAYSAEQRDAGWAARKEGELRGIAEGDALRAAGIEPAADLRVSCRQSLCETVADFDAGSGADDWLLGFMSSVGTASSRSFVRQEALPSGGKRLRIVSQAR